MKKPIPTAAGHVVCTSHAIYRYIERVKPACTYAHAHWELAQLLPQAEAIKALPEWASCYGEDGEARYETDVFLHLCGSILFPVFDGHVMTTLARGTYGPVKRRAKSDARKRRHSRHRQQKISERSGVQRRQRKAERDRRIDLGEAA